MELREILDAAVNEIKGEDTILPEARIARLREAAQRYHQPNPFKIGDLVTPRGDSKLRGAGQAQLVIEVRRNAELYFHGDESLPSFGARYDMRVLALTNKAIVAVCVESQDYERYTGEGA